MQRSQPHSDVVVISTTSVGRLKLKKVKLLAQDHVAGKRQRLTLNQICLAELFFASLWVCIRWGRGQERWLGSRRGGGTAKGWRTGQKRLERSADMGIASPWLPAVLGPYSGSGKDFWAGSDGITSVIQKGKWGSISWETKTSPW